MSIMRYPEGHKDEVRQRIVRAASEALRRSGLSKVSIPDLMKRAGLTHGGFYGYFSDRDTLVAEAIRAAGSQTANGLFAEESSLDDMLEHYLSEAHVAHPERGCVVAALGTEGKRQPEPVQGAFADVARGLLRLVEKKVHPEAKGATLSDDALRLGATMVGAVVLARLVGDASLSRRILRVARASRTP